MTIRARHGTFDDVIRASPAYSRTWGFDVLYFPPIHPIGRTNRKGRNNALKAAPDDPGSPYTIGADGGRSRQSHPELGTLEDFHAVHEAAAEAQGLEIALDFAIQCAPDHPWLAVNIRDGSRGGPDGSIKYAENPPKKYEDIVNVDFYADSRDPRPLGRSCTRSSFSGRSRACGSITRGQPAHEAFSRFGSG